MDALNLIFQRQMKFTASKYNKAPEYGASDDIFDKLKQAEILFYVLNLTTK